MQQQTTPIPLLLFDAETTGLNKERDEIIELAVMAGLDGPVKVWRFRPDVEIHPEAQAAHGISAKALESEPPFAALAPTLCALFQRAEVLGGYNVVFDIEILQRQLREAACPADLAGKPRIDGYRLWQQQEPRKLQDAHRRFCGAEFVGAHGAKADIEATGRVLRGMLQAFPALADLDWRQLAESCDPARKLWVGPTHHIQRRPDDGVPVFTFGKLAGRPVFEAARQERGYIEWMRGRDFPTHVLEISGMALALDAERFRAELGERYPQPGA